MALKKSCILKEQEVEGQTKTAKQMHLMKKLCWCACISMLVLCGIISILVLIKINFGVEAPPTTHGFKGDYNTRELAANASIMEYKSYQFYDERSNKCKTIQCKVECFNGKSSELENDIRRATSQYDHICKSKREIHLFEYEFPDNRIHYGFLGQYSYQMTEIHFCSSNITEIETGAFASSSLKIINFKELRLRELKSDFFKGTELRELFIKQTKTPLELVQSSFFHEIRSLIRFTLQAGQKSLHNLMAEKPATHLIHADFSYNHFGTELTLLDFSDLPGIEELILKRSNIEYLPTNLFVKIMLTLKYLDLSYNKLTTISRYIFGEIPMQPELIIMAKGNRWSCSCELQQNMKAIFMYHIEDLLCHEPFEFRNYSAFDPTFCLPSPDNATVIWTTPTKEEISATTPQYKTSSRPSTPPITDCSSIGLECLVTARNSSQSISHLIKKPLSKFELRPSNNFKIDVVVDYFEMPSRSLSLIWFRKASTTYFGKKYLSDCYQTISIVTAIQNLIPNTSYMFCIVNRKELHVSPFDCKSMHVGGSLEIKRSSWLTHDMKAPGLSLLIVGIVLCLIAAMLTTYFFLKRKPTFVKSSKRVMLMPWNSKGIVVLPTEESLRLIKEKEDKLFRNRQIISDRKRCTTTYSDTTSCQSYMNAHLYEVIPALEYNSLYDVMLPAGNRNRPGERNNRLSENSYRIPLGSDVTVHI